MWHAKQGLGNITYPSSSKIKLNHRLPKQRDEDFNVNINPEAHKMVEDAVARNTAEWRKSNPEASGQEIMHRKLVIRHQERIRLWEKMSENERKGILALQREDRHHGSERSVLRLEPFAGLLDETTESISGSNHNVIVYELTYLQENPS